MIYDKKISEKDIQDALDSIPSYQENKEQIELITKCLGMTEEQMKVDLTDGYYYIGTKQMSCLTGKGGFINFIMGIKNKIKTHD